MTPGWENVNPTRADISPAKKVWSAASAERDFTVEKLHGAEEMCAAVNSAPDMFYRKYTHFIAKEGLVTPVIVVGGTPSRTVWRDWIAEYLDAADTKWEGYFEAKSPVHTGLKVRWAKM